MVQVLLPVAVVFGLLLSAFFFGIEKLQQKNINNKIQEKIYGVQDLFAMELAEEAHFLHTLLLSYQDNPKLRKAFLARDREGLLEHARQIYQLINPLNGVTHFYFHDLKQINFLRVHQPSRHGDLIDRHTMMEAVKTGRLSQGIELGPLGTFTLRVVYPWRINNKLIGYLELGKEIEHITPEIREILGVELLFTIEKQHLNRSDWEEGLVAMEKTGDWNLFADLVLIDRTIADISPELRELLESLELYTLTGSPVDLPQVWITDRQYSVGRIPLIDAGGQTVGTITILVDVSKDVLAKKLTLKFLSAVFLSGALLLLLFFYLHINRLQKSLRQTLSSLELEVEVRKKSEKALAVAKIQAESANAAKSQFLANMSHEIRTPMNGIIGFSDLLMSAEISEVQQNYVRLIKSSGKRLLHIINDILDFSKIEAGKLEFEQIPFQLNSMIDDIMKMMAVKGQQKGLEIIYHIDSEIHDHLIGDPGRLRQIIVNLVGNSIKFTSDGEVVVRVKYFISPESSETDFISLHFTIQDTGIGIPEEKQNDIFKVFTQADGSVTRKYGGTGLGLAICSQLVENMGGRIWLKSVPGVGSEFHFTVKLQLNKDQDKVLEHIPLDEFMWMSVLVVDDNLTNRYVLAEMLKAWVNTVDMVGGGAEALTMLKEKSYDLIILDVQMPEMDGYSVAEKIKQDPQLREIPLIVLTSTGQLGDGKLCQKLGVTAYFMKPIGQAELLRAMRLALDKSELPKKSRRLITRHSLRELTTDFHILLAEDEFVNRTLATTILEQEGWQVTAVENGQEALDTYLADPSLDIILMDLQMPEMDGLEATRAIRRQEEKTGRRLPIIALTACAMIGDKEKCLEAGMDDYVTKPIDMVYLTKTISQYSKK